MRPVDHAVVAFELSEQRNGVAALQRNRTGDIDVVFHFVGVRAGTDDKPFVNAASAAAFSKHVNDACARNVYFNVSGRI